MQYQMHTLDLLKLQIGYNMKTQILETEISGQYILIIAPETNSSFSFNFTSNKIELNDLYVQLRDLLQDK